MAEFECEFEVSSLSSFEVFLCRLTFSIHFEVFRFLPCDLGAHACIVRYDKKSDFGEFRTRARACAPSPAFSIVYFFTRSARGEVRWYFSRASREVKLDRIFLARSARGEVR